MTEHPKTTTELTEKHKDEHGSEVGDRTLCDLCTTSVQDRRFRDVVSLRRLYPDAIGVLKTVVKRHPRRRNVWVWVGVKSVSICVHLWFHWIWLRPPRPRCALCGSMPSGDHS